MNHNGSATLFERSYDMKEKKEGTPNARRT